MTQGLGVFKGKRVLLVFFGLIILFFMDDFLLLMLVQKLDLFHVSGWIYYLVLTWLFIVSSLLAFAVLHIMRKKPTTGVEGLYGRKGTVVDVTRNQYRVTIKGEIWTAESDEKLKTGDKIIVRSVEGLLLYVDFFQ